MKEPRFIFANAETNSGLIQTPDGWRPVLALRIWTATSAASPASAGPTIRMSIANAEFLIQQLQTAIQEAARLLPPSKPQ